VQTHPSHEQEATENSERSPPLEFDKRLPLPRDPSQRKDDAHDSEDYEEVRDRTGRQLRQKLSHSRPHNKGIFSNQTPLKRGTLRGSYFVTVFASRLAM
jgi:hypothetical protein